jgi:putative ABC transport system permease protein
MRPSAPLFAWMLWGATVRERVRWLAALIMVGIGVMLAVAIHTVNHSALSSFGRALDAVNGQASAQLVSSLGEFDERRLDILEPGRLAMGITDMSPVLAVRTDRVLVLGIDVFQAARVTPALLPAAAEGVGGLFDARSIFLSASAQRTLQVRVGEDILLRHGLQDVRLRVAGDLPGVPGEALAVMDIGSAQWAFGRLGLISRIDIKLASEQTVEGLRDQLRAVGEPLAVMATEDRDRRMSNLSRAYRVNLTVLAMVALLTGGFLVSTAVNLSVIRQRSELALLGVLGAPVAWLRRLVWVQGGLVGALGGGLGVGLGLALAWLLMRLLGGDLGGGYFSQAHAPLVLDWPALAGFWALSTLVGLLAAWQPLRRIDWRAPMALLRAGQAEATGLQPPGLRWSGLGLLAAGLLMLVPPVGGLPWAAYAAIAAILFAGLAALPWLLAQTWGGLSRRLMSRKTSDAVMLMASWRLAQAPGVATPVITGTVAAFSLTVAMMIMVGSFRDSVSDWLQQVLPADLYSSGQSLVDAPGFDPSVGPVIAGLEGVRRVEMIRHRSLRLDTDRPEVMLMARNLRLEDPMQALPLVGGAILPPAGGDAVVVFGSEAMAGLYGWRVGTTAVLPLGPSGQQSVWVAGLYRDYGRQHGSVVLREVDYERLTGDRSRSGLSIWLQPGADPAAITQAVSAALPELGVLKWITATDVRALSLRIFDRSFAMTYVLEAAALCVALLSVAAGLAGQLLLRRREFALLAQLGLSRGDRLRLVSWEAGLLLLVAVAWGSVMGWLMSQVLIHKVNPESFHWTMTTTVDVPQWAVLSAALLLLGVVTARWAARQGLDEKHLSSSLRADW